MMSFQQKNKDDFGYTVNFEVNWKTLVLARK